MPAWARPLTAGCHDTSKRRFVRFSAGLCWLVLDVLICHFTRYLPGFSAFLDVSVLCSWKPTHLPDDCRFQILDCRLQIAAVFFQSAICNLKSEIRSSQ